MGLSISTTFLRQFTGRNGQGAISRVFRLLRYVRLPVMLIGLGVNMAQGQ